MSVPATHLAFMLDLDGDRERVVPQVLVERHKLVAGTVRILAQFSHLVLLEDSAQGGSKGARPAPLRNVRRTPAPLANIRAH